MNLYHVSESIAKISIPRTKLEITSVLAEDGATGAHRLVPFVQRPIRLALGETIHFGEPEGIVVA